VAPLTGSASIDGRSRDVRSSPKRARAAAGGHSLVDSAPCNGSSCDLTPDIGISGIYFSLNQGESWVQPTYTGLTARSGTAQVGPINTLPWYYENGMSSHGDPALAFGPRPDANGTFSWTNGSRLYYANLAFPIPGRAPFTGASAAAVSRTDNVAAAAGGDKSAWMAPVIVTRQNAALLSDKEDIWADNAATSRFFGNVYVCNTAFRSVGGPPSRSCSRPPATAVTPGASASSPRLPATPNPVAAKAVRSGPTAPAPSMWSGRAPPAARASCTWPARLTGVATSSGPGRSPTWSTSACPTRCRAGSSSTALPGPGPTASPAWALPTAPPPVPGHQHPGTGLAGRPGRAQPRAGPGADLDQPGALLVGSGQRGRGG
jgi:hypothetical protein